MTPTTDQLKDLLAKVTPGEWITYGRHVSSDALHEVDCIADHVYGPESNATLIALAPTLAAEVVRLREHIHKLTCEVMGVTGAFEGELRYVMGNTNFNALIHHAEAARQALTP